MKQQQLDRAFDRGLVISFASKKEQYLFLREIKSYGGKWKNGEEITLPDSPEGLEEIFYLHVDRAYNLSRVSAMCHHFGVFPTIKYENFKTDKAVIDVV